jgi:hypothetical protein
MRDVVFPLLFLLLALRGVPTHQQPSPPPFNVTVSSPTSTSSSVIISPPTITDNNRTFTIEVSYAWNRTLDRLVGGAPAFPQGWTAAYFTNNGTTPLPTPTTDAGWAQVDRVVTSGSYRNWGPVPGEEDLQVRERGVADLPTSAALSPLYLCGPSCSPLSP